MFTTSKPENLGAAQSVFDSTALAALDVNLTVGTRAYNATVDADFVLKVSTASLVTDEVVAVFGNDGLRWIKDAGGGGTVHTDDTLSGDGSEGDPLHAVAQFGQDTTIKIDDTGGTPVNALELIASLTVTTPGDTYSQWVIETLVAGAQVQSQVISGAQTLFPLGTAANPGVSFIGKAGFGMGYNAGIDGLVFSVNGAIEYGVYAASQFLLYGNGAAVIFGSTQTEKIARNGIQLQFYANGTVNFSMTDVGLGFYGHAAATKPTVTGSKGANAALASLLTGLASLGLLTDSST